MITESKVTEIFVLQMISAKNLRVRWQKCTFRPQTGHSKTGKESA